ncbi:ketol-acid reductoisomerase [bacterium]|jgi:ketol-acid reductoisomerase|nr:ketol-acid reductoisomerase [Mariniblastus sp.]MDB4368737.1 ketol-acid reductoisomerase [bacterium]MDA7928565.1 ketol-acid reductoisomerase [Mariniblastus sp.]MDB4372951.1 ketol-acid reductoisomerase [Mariniblastus sp.]MDB4466673.1 ketol-acid reductoisomerase [bacterium]
MTTMFFESDINTQALENLCVAMIGYGSQGRGQAMNLRDSGINVVLGLREGGKSWEQAVSEGWTPLSMEEAAKQADVVCMMCPDMAQPQVYRDIVAPNLKPGSTVLFSHGFCIHYGAITVTPENNVVMLAPKGPGGMVRRQYEEGSGVPGLVAVHQDATGNAMDIALSYGWAIGAARAGIIKTTFPEETETDLFGEQAVLCGGLTELITAGWETLVEAGYQPDVAYFECLHEVKLIVDLIYEGGIARMHEFISDTAAYGDLVSGKRIITDETRANMKAVLKDIQDGTFAKQWQEEAASGSANFKRMMEEDIAHPIEATGQALRKQFSWLQQNQS